MKKAISISGQQLLILIACQDQPTLVKAEGTVTSMSASNPDNDTMMIQVT